MSIKMLSNIEGEEKPIVLVPGGLTGWMSWEKHAVLLAENEQPLFYKA